MSYRWDPNRNQGQTRLRSSGNERELHTPNLQNWTPII